MVSAVPQLDELKAGAFASDLCFSSTRLSHQALENAAQQRLDLLAQIRVVEVGPFQLRSVAAPRIVARRRVRQQGRDGLGAGIQATPLGRICRSGNASRSIFPAIEP